MRESRAFQKCDRQCWSTIRTCGGASPDNASLETILKLCARDGPTASDDPSRRTLTILNLTTRPDHPRLDCGSGSRGFEPRHPPQFAFGELGFLTVLRRAAQAALAPAGTTPSSTPNTEYRLQAADCGPSASALLQSRGRATPPALVPRVSPRPVRTASDERVKRTPTILNGPTPPDHPPFDCGREVAGLNPVIHQNLFLDRSQCLRVLVVVALVVTIDVWTACSGVQC